MNYNQNIRIAQVTESTLIVGVDIGSTTHFARAFNWRGIELGKVFKFSNTREGFVYLKNGLNCFRDVTKRKLLLLEQNLPDITGSVSEHIWKRKTFR